MRLLTHNLLACHAKGCGSSSNNFPLQLRNVQLELIEAEYNDVFLRGFLPKLDWNALVTTAQQVRPTRRLTDSSARLRFRNRSPTLRKRGPATKCCRRCTTSSSRYVLHTDIQLHIAEGEMVCPKCAHVYPIRSGIPNMVRVFMAHISSLPSTRFPSDRTHSVLRSYPSLVRRMQVEK